MYTTSKLENTREIYQVSTVSCTQAETG